MLILLPLLAFVCVSLLIVGGAMVVSPGGDGVRSEEHTSELQSH